LFQFIEEAVLFSGDAIFLQGEIPIFTDVKNILDRLKS